MVIDAFDAVILSEAGYVKIPPVRCWRTAWRLAPGASGPQRQPARVESLPGLRARVLRARCVPQESAATATASAPSAGVCLSPAAASEAERWRPAPQGEGSARREGPATRLIRGMKARGSWKDAEARAREQAEGEAYYNMSKARLGMDGFEELQLGRGTFLLGSKENSVMAALDAAAEVERRRPAEPSPGQRGIPPEELLDAPRRGGAVVEQVSLVAGGRANPLIWLARDGATAAALTRTAHLTGEARGREAPPRPRAAPLRSAPAAPGPADARSLVVPRLSAPPPALLRRGFASAPPWRKWRRSRAGSPTRARG